MATVIAGNRIAGHRVQVGPRLHIAISKACIVRGGTKWFGRLEEEQIHVTQPVNKLEGSVVWRKVLIYVKNIAECGAVNPNVATTTRWPELVI